MIGHTFGFIVPKAGNTVDDKVPNRIQMFGKSFNLANRFKFEAGQADSRGRKVIDLKSLFSK